MCRFTNHIQMNFNGYWIIEHTVFFLFPSFYFFSFFFFFKFSPYWRFKIININLILFPETMINLINENLFSTPRSKFWTRSGTLLFLLLFLFLFLFFVFFFFFLSSATEYFRFHKQDVFRLLLILFPFIFIWMSCMILPLKRNVVQIRLIQILWKNLTDEEDPQ